VIKLFRKSDFKCEEVKAELTFKIVRLS